MLPYGPMRSRVAEAVLVVAVAIVLAIVMTWPLTPRIALGGRIDTNDGRISVWTVAWVARALVHEPRGLYDANFFYPHRNTLAYLEPNILLGALAVPVYWATKNPYLTYNFIILLSFVLAQAGMYALVRHLFGSRTGAAVAGVAFGFCPYVFSHIPHSQLLMTAGLPFALLAMHRFVERRTAARAITLGLVVAAEALACGYYGIYVAMILVPGMVYYACTRGLWREARYWAGAAGAGLLAILLVLPFFLPVIGLQQDTGFARPLAESRRWSATWRSYLASSAWAHRWMKALLVNWGEVIYPGTMAAVLGLAGAWTGWLRSRREGGRDHVVFYSAIGLLALWLSLGPDAGLYALLYRVLPVFSLLHAPSRFGLLVTLALCVFAGRAVSRWMEKKRRPGWIAAALVALSLGDLFTAPLFLVDAPPLSPVYSSLAKWPYGAVVEMPFFHLRVDYHRHAEYMLFSTFHWKPLINGYADYTPPEFRDLAPRLSSFPNAESFALLKPMRPHYVVFHWDLYDHRQAAEVKQRIEEYRDYLQPIRIEDPVWLYQIVGWPPQR